MHSRLRCISQSSEKSFCLNLNLSNFAGKYAHDNEHFDNNCNDTIREIKGASKVIYKNYKTEIILLRKFYENTSSSQMIMDPMVFIFRNVLRDVKSTKTHIYLYIIF